ncbi:MAG: alpha/beta fold hydrolase [Patescibacteria group bacterium]
MKVHGAERGTRAPTVTTGEYEVSDRSHTDFVHVVPERVTQKCKVIIAPGMGESARIYTEPAVALAKLGHEVYAMSHDVALPDEHLEGIMRAELARARARYANALPRSIDALIRGIRITEFRKALALKTFIESKVQKGTDEKIDVVGHSQGGAYVTIAAFLWPELFDHVVLMNSAGHNGDVGYSKLFRRFMTGLSKRAALNSSKMVDVALESVRLIRKNGGFFKGRAVDEARSLVSFNAFPYLNAITQTVGRHIKIFRVYDANDSVFPHDEVLAEERRNERSIGTGRFGTRVTTHHKGHYSFIEKPDAVATELHALLA